jgi:hypothetical protein
VDATNCKSQISFPESHELQATLLSSVVTSSLARPVAFITLDRPRTLAHLTSFWTDVSIPRNTASYSNKQQRVRNPQDSALAGRTFVLNPPLITPAQKTPAPSNVESAESVKLRPLTLQLRVWQVPSMLQGWSAVIFVTGLPIWAFATAKNALDWGDEKRIAVFFGRFMASVAGNYMLSWICIERRVQVGISKE